MSEFDNFINEAGFNFHPTDYYLYKSIFEAGAQSKKAEIDELRKQLELINQYTAAQGEAVKIANDERLELRKRIDDAIERSNHAHIGYQMLYKQFDDVMKILKGTTNEQ